MEEALRNDPRPLASSAAELIKREREKRHITPQRAAKAAGIALDTYEALESGKLSPPEIQPGSFARILKSLDIGMGCYLDVHGRSVRPGSIRNLTKRAALKHRSPSSPRNPRVASTTTWLTRLAEAMQE
jgi:transcriptional regulator with XRE-family HTH domain